MGGADAGNTTTTKARIVAMLAAPAKIAGNSHLRMACIRCRMIALDCHPIHGWSYHI
jgi:hypothetical protein